MEGHQLPEDILGLIASYYINAMLVPKFFLNTWKYKKLVIDSNCDGLVSMSYIDLEKIRILHIRSTVTKGFIAFPDINSDAGNKISLLINQVEYLNSPIVGLTVYMGSKNNLKLVNCQGNIIDRGLFDLMDIFSKVCQNFRVKIDLPDDFDFLRNYIDTSRLTPLSVDIGSISNNFEIIYDDVIRVKYIVRDTRNLWEISVAEIVELNNIVCTSELFITMSHCENIKNIDILNPKNEIGTDLLEKFKSLVPFANINMR